MRILSHPGAILWHQPPGRGLDASVPCNLEHCLQSRCNACNWTTPHCLFFLSGHQERMHNLTRFMLSYLTGSWLTIARLAVSAPVCDEGRSYSIGHFGDGYRPATYFHRPLVWVSHNNCLHQLYGGRYHGCHHSVFYQRKALFSRLRI